MSVITAYIDTTVLKFSATKLRRFQPRISSFNWGGTDFDAVIHDLVEFNPNDQIKNNELKIEAELLPQLVELGKRGVIRYLLADETLYESWGLPNMDSQSGRFYGAPIERCEAPIKYDRIVVSFEDSGRALQYDFLCSIKKKEIS